VKTDEALAMGLVNRIVPRGQARAAAEQLAHELSQLPQAALRADRMSAYLQHDLDLEAALAKELELGSRALAEAVDGAKRFSDGAGRHGGRA
jgi:enoyl-CoA hydratase